MIFNKQQEAPKPKKKRKYRKRNIKDLLKNIPPIPNGLISSSVDTSYIRPPLSYQQFRDVVTQPGYQMSLLQPQLPPPQQQLQLPAPPQQLQLPAPPVTINNNTGLPTDWYKYLMMPHVVTNEPEIGGLPIEDVTDDPLYNALNPVQQEAYKDQKTEQQTQDIIDKAQETVANVEASPFFGTVTAEEQTRIKNYTLYKEIQNKVSKMSEASRKRVATRDIRTGRPPRYADDKIYRKTYREGVRILLREQVDIINDTASTDAQKTASEAEIRRIETLNERLNLEKTRITRILKNKP